MSHDNETICEHGSLRRSCELCERDARIAELIDGQSEVNELLAYYPKRIRELEEMNAALNRSYLLDRVVLQDNGIAALRAQLARADDVEGMARVIYKKRYGYKWDKDDLVTGDDRVLCVQDARAVSAWLKEGK